jgi:hypothetical protein
MAVGIVDVVIDFLDQSLHAAKRSPTKSLLRDAIDPTRSFNSEELNFVEIDSGHAYVLIPIDD